MSTESASETQQSNTHTSGAQLLLKTVCFAGQSALGLVLVILAGNVAFSQVADSFDPTANDTCRAFVVQPDGRIVVGGSFYGLGHVAHPLVGRVTANGVVEESFNPGVVGQSVISLALQPDRKILIGGAFTKVGVVQRNNLARLNQDGTVDPGFNPAPDEAVLCLGMQEDGKILVGGAFTAVGGQNRAHLCRLHNDGSLDTSFVPSVDGDVVTLAIQPDGRIIVGGQFVTLNGQPRNKIGRLNSDGSLDSTFNPGADVVVKCVTLQSDGKVLVTGAFTSLAGQTRTGFGRLHPDGTLDVDFNPGLNSQVYSLALQADGKILAGGYFTRIAGQDQKYIARLNADGTFDTTFRPDCNYYVNSVALQADGKVLLGGIFTSLGGQPRSCIGRLINTDPAMQSLVLEGGMAKWCRGGTCPEVSRVSFEIWTNDGEYVHLGEGTRVPGGWQSVAVGQVLNPTIRARGYIPDSSWFVESFIGPPVLLSQPSTRTNNAASDAIFKVTALNTDSYQWRVGQTWLSDGAGLSGARTSTLIVSNVLGANAGAYSIILSNKSGMVTSEVATLVVLDPIIAAHPASRTNDAGTPATFTVTAAGTPPLSYQWRKGDFDLEDGGDIAGAHSSTLSLTDLFGPDMGTYLVIISNSFGSLTSSMATLTVVNDPYVASHPVSQLVADGDTVAMDVVAGGTPPFTYQWRKSGTNLTGATAASLTKTNVQAADLGSYDVVVTGPFGSSTSRVATLSYPTIAKDFGPPMHGPSVGGALYALAIQLDGKVLIGGNITNVAGQQRDSIARLSADGTLEEEFNPGAKGWVYSLAVQPDGKILVAGAFTNICQQVRNRIARLNPDGSLDLAFNPGANSTVYSIVLLPSRKLLIGGSFSQINGQSRSGVARLNPDGTLDTAFDAGSIMNVYSVAAQPDGRILVGGSFSSVAGQQRHNLARLSADGLLDSSFSPNTYGGFFGTVRCISVKTDGKLIVAGSFATLSGDARNNIGCLNADGSLDQAFDPNANGPIYSIAQQADGGILIGGQFTTVGGLARARIARLNADGTVDSRLNASASTSVYTIALQPQGGVLMAGAFPIMAPANGNRIRRLDKSEPATQTLSFDVSTVTWLRGGTSPEVWRTTFEVSTNGSEWLLLGAGTPVSGGWNLSEISLPLNAAVRARGLTTQSYQGGASWFVEAIAGRPGITAQPLNRTNNAGTVASFSVLGGGTSPVFFTWLKNGEPLADGTSVTGANTPTLTLSNVLRADEGVYSLVLSNSIGVTTSAVATLAVLDPAINRNPTSHIVNVGQPLRLNVEAAGTPPLSYQWRKNGDDLAGATDSTYSPPADQWLDGSSYDVAVRNVLGSVTSLVAVISVNMVPPDTFSPSIEGIPYAIAPELGGALLFGGGFRNLAGQPRKALGRLWADGTIDASFDAKIDGVVYALALQEDGGMLVGGDFSTIGGQTRFYLGRLNPDGSLDTNFTPGASSGTVQYVNCLALQSDRKILVGGYFSLMGGQPRSGIARLNPDGTADPSFNPAANGAVRCMVVQPDGKIVIGGTFTTLGGQSCNYLSRLNSDGSRDAGFNPTIDNALNCVALQHDGKILIGGVFSTVYITRNYLARLNPDGTLDGDFNPVLGGVSPSSPLYSIALQADGKILLAGSFNTLNGERRQCLGRLNPDGTLDVPFNVPALGGTVPLCYALSLQFDGSILVGGAFTTLGGEIHTNVGRMLNSEPATQTLNLNDSTMTWLRGGSSPELSRAWFEATTNGLDWISLGEGSRSAGGWRRTNIAAPQGASIRARGFASGGMYNGSTYLVESKLPGLIPDIITQPQSQSVHAGGTLGLTVAAVGKGPLSYQWWTDGEPIPGQTNDTLSVVSVQQTNSGTYSVIISNEFGTATSKNAIVRVLATPVLELPSLLPDGTVLLQFRDSDRALTGDLANISAQWRTNLPSGKDTNWQVLDSVFYVTNGLIRFEDTNRWNLPSRFYRVLEQ